MIIFFHLPKAFDRYCQIADDDSLDMSQLIAKARGKIVDLKAAKKAGGDAN